MKTCYAIRLCLALRAHPSVEATQAEVLVAYNISLHHHLQSFSFVEEGGSAKVATQLFGSGWRLVSLYPYFIYSYIFLSLTLFVQPNIDIIHYPTRPNLYADGAGSIGPPSLQGTQAHEIQAQLYLIYIQFIKVSG